MWQIGLHVIIIFFPNQNMPINQIFIHNRLPRKIRGLPRGRHRGVTFGESQGELTGVTRGDLDFGVLLPLHFRQRMCWS